MSVSFKLVTFGTDDQALKAARAVLNGAVTRGATIEQVSLAGQELHEEALGFLTNKSEI